ncbi:MAG: dinitrogenase iron-molybdenum cofactor [Alkaliphilus sp.]|nr:NifB/NifX family molybdenum-iron cluster-binding protein [bacterium AH-315-L21]PHS33846.1 MAG: dinitrogenase iron-molybdenum cofactor [Alkaliphilus sp.]
MKIAIAKDGNMVSGHFGHCEGFQVYHVEAGEVLGNEFLENPGHRPGFLPKYLSENGANIIIAGGMGATAQELFKDNGIEVVVGVQGSLESIINQFLGGNLVSSKSVCSEHAHKDSCGGH